MRGKLLAHVCAHSLTTRVNKAFKRFYLSTDQEVKAEYKRCRKVSGVTASGFTPSLSMTIFSMRQRSGTVNLLWLMRMSSWMGETLLSSSTILAAMWRQQTPMQGKCLGCTFSRKHRVSQQFKPISNPIWSVRWLFKIMKTSCYNAGGFESSLECLPS